jgi:acyl-coenzyme A synthetase/AMP-(fatty) acid ligase
MVPLRDRLGNSQGLSDRFLWGGSAAVRLADLARGGTALGGRLEELTGRSVLISTGDQLATGLALVELDGVARRMVICTPDLPPEHLPTVMDRAEVDAVVSDRATAAATGVDLPLEVACSSAIAAAGRSISARQTPTEWVLLTSGTTGAPKMLVHTLEGLTAAFSATRPAAGVVWGTFYDIRRYGGLQIFLRAVAGGGSFVLGAPDESPGEYLARLAAHGVTHLSGTPSHWRRALMTPQARAISPGYVRLSGEIADQSVLNALAAFYPTARVGHAFASTEAGVGFEVNDGQEGFPASLLSSSGDVAMKVEDGSLRIRSTRNAVRYLGEAGLALSGADGFVDTGDMVERRGDRYYFLGRKSGMINVGGLKVYPEEVEAVINLHPAVRMSMVRPRRSPITGSLIAADIVLDDGSNGSESLRLEILEACRRSLPAHKVPATLRFVASLEMAAAGKLARRA